MLVVGNEELGDKLGSTYDCPRCGQTHNIIDSTPPGKLQAVRCGEALYLVGIDGRALPEKTDE